MCKQMVFLYTFSDKICFFVCPDRYRLFIILRSKEVCKKKVPLTGTSINGSRDNSELLPLLQQMKQAQILSTLQLSSRI